jgi:hypothetical protein
VHRRRLTAAIGLVLVVSISASVWARCIADFGMTPAEQMACCKDGHGKCPMHNTAADCCKAESQRHQQVSFATHESVRSAVHPPAIVAILPVAIAPVAVPFSHTTFERAVLKGPDPPPYLLGSAFRV